MSIKNLSTYALKISPNYLLHILYINQLQKLQLIYPFNNNHYSVHEILDPSVQINFQSYFKKKDFTVPKEKYELCLPKNKYLNLYLHSFSSFNKIYLQKYFLDNLAINPIDWHLYSKTLLNKNQDRSFSMLTNIISNPLSFENQNDYQLLHSFLKYSAHSKPHFIAKISLHPILYNTFTKDNIIFQMKDIIKFNHLINQDIIIFQKESYQFQKQIATLEILH